MSNKPQHEYRRSLIDAEIIIHGVVYDIKDFKHPGGSIIMNQLNPVGAAFPADGTIAFDSLHSHSRLPTLALAKLKREGKSRMLTNEEKLAMNTHRPHDAALSEKFREVTKRLHDLRMFEYSALHLIGRTLEIIGLTLLGAWCAIRPNAVFGWWSSALLLGIAMQRAGWLQHECNHGSISKNWAVNRILGSFWFGFGEAGSGKWWRREHSRHHADPQRHGADFDMNTLPLALDSLTARRGNSAFIRIQAWIYQFAVWGLVHFWQLWLHPRHIMKNGAVLDGTFLVLHWVVWLAAFVPSLGWCSALALHIVASAIEASLLFTNFALSHSAMPFIAFELHEHWVERALRRTIDIHSHSNAVGPVLGPIIDSAVDWLMGFLNYQVVHHLWPLMPHHKQSDPRVHAAVRELAAHIPELDMVYNVATYWRAMYDMYANLSSIAHDHGAGARRDANHPTKPDWVLGVGNAPDPIPILKKN